MGWYTLLDVRKELTPTQLRGRYELVLAKWILID